MDLKISTETEKFKCRACGIIINDNKILGLRMAQNDFFCCPGGHVHLGEDSKQAVLRETQEEIGLEFEVVKLVSIIENFFTSVDNKKFHEMSFYYLMKAKDLKEKSDDFSLVENDEGKLIQMDYKWFNITDLDKVDFRPSILVNKLKNNNFNFEHIIFHE